MQFIPVADAGSSRSLWDIPGKTSNEDSQYGDFLKAVHEAVDKVEQGQNTSVNEALQESDTSAARVESPYSRPTINGITYTLEEVSFTKAELLELRAQLLKSGAPEESLKRLDALADQPDGAVLAQVLASLQFSRREIKLSPEDSDNITALLGKIDPSGDLAPQALLLMSAGRGQDALQLISAAFEKLGPGETIDMSKAEILSLGRGLGLNQGSLKALSSDFGNYPALRSNSSQFAALMAPATTQFSTDISAQKKLDAAAEKVLQPLISKARSRMEKEKEAVSRESRKVQLGRALIDKTVQANSREILDNTLKTGQEAGADAAASEITSAKSAALAQASKGKNGEKQPGQPEAGPEHAGFVQASGQKNAQAEAPTAEHLAAAALAAKANTASANNTAAGTPNGAEADPRAAAQAAQANARRNGENFEDSSRKDNRNDTTDKKEWNSLLNKVEVRSSNVETPRDSGLVYSLLHPTSADTHAPKTSMSQQGDMSRLSRHVAQQVEQGMLSSLRSGGTRLDLQLNPEQLGAITISLTARNGEVSAIIRSEKTETAELMSRQLDTIRVNLEQQGIKVDKIEVQLQNRDSEQGNTWQNLDQHNARQEEDARREELARLKNLSNMRNSTDNDELSTLEQPVQYTLHTAINAGRALNVVA